MKTGSVKTAASAPINFDLSDLDLTELIGQPVTVFSRQFPGKPLPNKIISSSKRELQLQSDGSFGSMSNLVNSQRVIIQIPYKGEWISVRATLKKTDGGRCSFVLEDRVVPLSQRKFVRIRRKCEVQLAAFSFQTFAQRPLNQLKWIKTNATSFSSGGALVEVPGHIDKGLKMLLNIDIDLNGFPELVLAEVRYCFVNEHGQRVAGVEFVVREVAQKQYSIAILKQLPRLVLKYTAPVREKINRLIQAGLEKSGPLS